MIDWAAKWFEVRAELGQSDLATMMYQDEDQSLIRAHFHHREADGFGKISSLLQNENIQLAPPTRKLKKPSRWLSLYLLFKGIMLHPTPKVNPWRQFDPSKASGAPDEVAFWFLTEKENQQLKKNSEVKHLNLSFYILSEIDFVLKRSLFSNPHLESTWLCPVDVRGGFENPKLGHNYVSFVPVMLPGLNSVERIQNSFEKYRLDLKSGLYWAFWELAQIGKWIGVSGMRLLARMNTTNKLFWMGSYSDLGVWNQPELQSSLASTRSWVIAPPGSPAYPVGVTTLEWCGKRSITIKIHPAICSTDSKKTAEKILSDLKKKVLETNSSSETRWSSESPKLI